MTDIEDLERRLAVIETREASKRKAAAEWFALPVEERARRLGKAATSGGIYYLTDYNQPADVPAYSLASANSVQTALNLKSSVRQAQQGVSDVHTGPGSGTDDWQPYRTITAEAPAWQGLGAWLEFARDTRPGLWIIRCHGYLDVQGGTANEVACFLGVESEWAEAGSAPVDVHPAVGRLTAPKATRIVVAQQALTHIQNDGSRRLRVRGAGQIATSVTGSLPKIGVLRITAEFRPDPYTLTINGYAPGG